MRRWIALCAVIGGVLVAVAAVQAAWSSTATDSLYPNCRFGVGMSVNGPITEYNVGQLGLGWYMNWNTSSTPSRPNGVQFVHGVIVHQNQIMTGTTRTYLPGHIFTPTLNAGGLGASVAANPDSIWIIGNEPDRDGPAGIMPDEFAKAYHEVYYYIKSVDPAARVAMPGLVEVTPLRLKYLDTISSTFRSLFTETLPVDVWTQHTYILPEGLTWGAHIPLGITPTQQTPAMTYTISMHDSQSIFQQQVRDMRIWMNQSGYRNTPLLWTEFGILYPADYLDEQGNDFDTARVNAFMNATFDFFRTATDATVGYPGDADRLVQAWAWYSVADTLYNGALFDPVSGQITSLGRNYADYTKSLGPDPMIPALAALPVYAPLKPVTVTLTAYVHNRGNADFTGNYTVTFYLDAAHTLPIDSVMLTDLASNVTQTLQVLWPSLSPGLYPFYAVFETDGIESNPCNNWSEGAALVADHQSFLPTIRK